MVLFGFLYSLSKVGETATVEFFDVGLARTDSFIGEEVLGDLLSEIISSKSPSCSAISK